MSSWKIVRLAALLTLIPVAAQAWPTVAAEITPRLPTDIDEVRLLLRGQIDGCTYLDFPEVVDAPAGGPGTPIDDEHVIQVIGEIQGIHVLCTGGEWSDEVRIGAGTLVPGRYRLEVYARNPADVPPPSDTLLAVVRFEVGLNQHLLRLQNNDIAVAARFTGGPAAGQGLHAVAQSKESGYFWSFGSGNVELTVKVLDGGDLNGKLWVFLAPMTTLGLEVAVYDARGCALPLCRDKTYEIPPGVTQSIIDIDAFHSEKP